MRNPKALLAILVTLGMALTIGCSGADEVVSAGADPGRGPSTGQAPPAPDASQEFQDDGGGADLR